VRNDILDDYAAGSLKIVTVDEALTLFVGFKLLL
jgi:hypothetical protein